MLKRKMGQFGLLAAAPAVLLASASAVHAQYAVAGTSSLVVDTFNNPASFTNNEVNGGPAGTNWYDGFNPPPPNIRLDYGSATATAHHSVTWSPLNSPDTSLGSPTSGSVKLAWTWNTVADGDGSAAFTMDILNTAQAFTSVSFDMYIDPSSTHGQYANNGPSTAGTAAAYTDPSGYNDYGYMQIFAKDQSYNQREGTGGPDATSIGDSIGNNPTTGLADTGTAETAYGAGMWERFTVDFTGAAKNVRAIVFQSFSQGESGSQAIYLDNITLNSATPIPEPASIGLLALAGSSMLMRRRRQV
jgi:hypothetical protein